MDYELNLDDVFEFKGDDYIVVDKIKYKESEYFFVNKLLNEEEPGKEFYVMKGLKEGLIIEKNEEILNEIYPIFSSNINKKIEYFKETDEV